MHTYVRQDSNFCERLVVCFHDGKNIFLVIERTRRKVMICSLVFSGTAQSRLHEAEEVSNIVLIFHSLPELV